MHTIFLSLGSNIGDKRKAIEKAIVLLKKEIIVDTIAPFYETKPVGFIDQENFYNTVLRGKTSLTPEELLVYIKQKEKNMGRIKRFINGPREIDIDILFYDDIIYKSKHVIIPHPRITQRDFMLLPMSDIDPFFIHPEKKKTIIQLLKKVSKEKRSIVKVR
jgi:2-amino-4-hydroxy-6-hydroxymethyldihydropteridine diphosphokinase